MKKNFDRIVLILTLLLGGAGCAFCLMIYGRTAQDTWGRIIWSGLFFSLPFVTSLLGSYLAEALQSRRFTVLRKRGRIFTMILAAASGFLVGAGGQALYMISAFEKNPAMDIVLLLDGSGSMEDEKEGCDKAARALLDQMDENSRAQVVSFAATVLGNTDLLPMDEAGKDTITDFIRSIDVIGGTEFGQPLTFALNSLRENKEEQRAQAVILLSDGEGPLPDSLKEEYIKEGLLLYTIRIDTGTKPTADTEKLIDMAKSTGGFDTLIPVDKSGQADTQELISAFGEAFTATREIGMGEQMIVFGNMNGSVIFRFLIRTLVFALYAVLVGAIYYRSLQPEQILGNLTAGLLLSVLVTLFGQIGLETPVLSAVLFCVLIFCAYTTYDEEATPYV